MMMRARLALRKLAFTDASVLHPVAILIAAGAMSLSLGSGRQPHPYLLQAGHRHRPDNPTNGAGDGAVKNFVGIDRGLVPKQSLNPRGDGI